MTTMTDAADAGTLLQYALGGRLPSEGSDYGRVYQRYRTEPSFKELTDAVAGGLGLMVVKDTPSGLVLAGQPGSPFAFRLSELGMSASDQQLFGLVLLGIATLAYPTEQHLDSSSAQIVSIARVVRFMRGAVGKLEALPAQEASFEAWVASAAKAYAERPDFIPTPKEKRAAKGCNQRTVEEALAWLVRQKLASEGRHYGPGHYLLRDRFRVLVGDVAGSDALSFLRDLGRRERREQSAEEPA